MSRKLSLQTPFGNLEYEWDKIVKDPNADKKVITNIVQSFLIGIECEEDIDPAEIDKLLEKIKAYGHLGKFKSDEVENYKILVKRSKELKIVKLNARKQVFLNLIQEIKACTYGDKELIMEKAKRTIAGLFGNESQQYKEYREKTFLEVGENITKLARDWKTRIKKEMIAKIQSYIAELKLL